MPSIPNSLVKARHPGRAFLVDVVEGWGAACVAGRGQLRLIVCMNTFNSKKMRCERRLFLNVFTRGNLNIRVGRMVFCISMCLSPASLIPHILLFLFHHG